MGQSEVTPSTSSPVCDLLDPAIEVEVIVGEERTQALVDSWSILTSVGETYYTEHLEEKYPLRELNGLLVVEGAGGHLLEYLGYIEVDLIVSGHSNDLLWTPMMVAPDTSYKRVPLLIGTNVINKLHEGKEDDLWSLAIHTLSVQETVAEDVAVYCCKQIVIPPN